MKWLSKVSMMQMDEKRRTSNMFNTAFKLPEQKYQNKGSPTRSNFFKKAR
jgi:hypothetical protein